MFRLIEFRGVDSVTGRYVYGAYVPFLGNDDLPMIQEPHNRGAFTAIRLGSLAQLIAIDMNGKKVFETDKVVRIADSADKDFDAAKAFPMSATFEDYAAILNGEIILAEEAKIKQVA